MSARKEILLPPRMPQQPPRLFGVEVGQKLGAGSYWQDNDLVFVSKYGGPLDAQNVVNRYYKPLLERAGLPRFHDLRHSCLSLLAAHGEPIRDL